MLRMMLLELQTMVGGCRFYTWAVALAHEGKESRANMAWPQLLMARVMQPIPMMFITTPVLACRAAPCSRGAGYGAQLHIVIFL